VRELLGFLARARSGLLPQPRGKTRRSGIDLGHLRELSAFSDSAAFGVPRG
jgi:hypothetical protein